MNSILYYYKYSRLLFIAFVAFAAGCGDFNSRFFSGNNMEPKAEFINEIFMEWDTAYSPGGSAAIVKDGKVIFIKGYGYADLEMNSPITPKTGFYIASMSKQFTGYCLATLIFEGRVSLDDDVRKIIPELSGINCKISIGDLVYQKSGLRDHMGLIPLSGHNIQDYITGSDVLYLLNLQKELNFPVGERWEYSNTNYFLMGEIVKRVTGVSLREYADSVIFKPLKMDNTLFVDSLETLVPDRAKSYRRNRDGTYSNDPFLDATVGHTGVYSTAEDMAKWLIYLRKLYKEEDPVFNLMLQSDTLNSGDEMDFYSFGFFKTMEGPVNYWHRGSFFGYKSIIIYYPERDFGLAMLGNVQSFKRRSYAEKVTQLFYPEDKKNEDVNHEGFSVTDFIREINIPVDCSLIKKYEGNYIVEPMLIYRVSQTGKSLYFGEYGYDEKSKLIGIGSNRFRDENNKFLVSFYEGDNSMIDSLVYTSESGIVAGEKAKSLTVSDENAFLGDYYNDELDMTITIDKSESSLVARNFRLGRIRLIPTYADEFLCDHDFFSYIRIYRDNRNSIKGFLLNGFGVSNIKYEKLSIHRLSEK